MCGEGQGGSQTAAQTSTNLFGRMPLPPEGVVAGKTASGDKSSGKGGKRLVTYFRWQERVSRVTRCVWGWGFQKRFPVSHVTMSDRVKSLCYSLMIKNKVLGHGNMRVRYQVGCIFNLKVFISFPRTIPLISEPKKLGVAKIIFKNFNQH